MEAGATGATGATGGTGGTWALTPGAGRGRGAHGHVRAIPARGLPRAGGGSGPGMPVVSTGPGGPGGPTTTVTHVIFDVDGTLLDTGPLYRQAIVQVLGWS